MSYRKHLMTSDEPPSELYKATEVGTDLISRQAAIDAYGDWYVEEGTEEGFIGTVKQLLEGLPSAQPEIIRCKDCKWKHGSECVRFADVRPFADDYCSRAERRTDE